MYYANFIVNGKSTFTELYSDMKEINEETSKILEASALWCATQYRQKLGFSKLFNRKVRVEAKLIRNGEKFATVNTAYVFSY